MSRFTFLLPAALAGFAVAFVAVVAGLSQGLTLALIGVVGFVLLCVGALQDLGVDFKRRKVVKVHEAAIRAEERNSPEAGKLFVAPDTWDEHRLLTNQPVWVVTGRTRIKVYFRKKPRKRGVISGHFADPMLPPLG